MREVAVSATVAQPPHHEVLTMGQGGVITTDGRKVKCRLRQQDVLRRHPIHKVRVRPLHEDDAAGWMAREGDVRSCRPARVAVVGRVRRGTRKARVDERAAVAGRTRHFHDMAARQASVTVVVGAQSPKVVAATATFRSVGNGAHPEDVKRGGERGVVATTVTISCIVWCRREM